MAPKNLFRIMDGSMHILGSGGIFARFFLQQEMLFIKLCLSKTNDPVSMHLCLLPPSPFIMLMPTKTVITELSLPVTRRSFGAG